MGTMAGAFVKWNGFGPLVDVLDEHHIDMVTVEPTKGWLYVQTAASFTSLRVPSFARLLSEQLKTQVIGFFLQSTASAEEIVCFDGGRRVRSLRFNADEGGWLEREGTSQPWEAAYFFADEAGVDEEATWPLDLPDEIEDDDRARYSRARAAGNPEPILDLLWLGSGSGLHRLGRHLGVDLDRPDARHDPPENRRHHRKVALVGLAIALFWAFMFYLGARPR